MKLVNIQMPFSSLIKTTFFLLISMCFLQCASIKTAPFNAYSYQKSIEIKVQTEQLVTQASQSFGNHQLQIDQLQEQLKLILAYEKYRPNNEITYAMWQKLADPNTNLIGGFINLWQEKDKLSPAFLQEVKAQINQALELLIKYEVNKNKENGNQITQFLNQ